MEPGTRCAEILGAGRLKVGRRLLDFQAHQGTAGLERIAPEWAALSESIPG